MAGSEPKETKANFEHLKVSAEDTLRYNVGAVFQVFGPEDFA